MKSKCRLCVCVCERATKSVRPASVTLSVGFGACLYAFLSMSRVVRTHVGLCV